MRYFFCCQERWKLRKSRLNTTQPEQSTADARENPHTEVVPRYERCLAEINASHRLLVLPLPLYVFPVTCSTLPWPSLAAENKIL